MNVLFLIAIMLLCGAVVAIVSAARSDRRAWQRREELRRAWAARQQERFGTTPE